MTGSVTHCAGYRAAAVALTGDVQLLGVDAEPNRALPDAVMLDMVAHGDEREHLELLAARMGGVCWDRLLLSAKLSVYKLWFPQAIWAPDFALADIVIEPYAGTFIANLLAPGPIVGGTAVTEIRGRWLADQGLLATAAAVTAR